MLRTLFSTKEDQAFIRSLFLTCYGVTTIADDVIAAVQTSALNVHHSFWLDILGTCDVRRFLDAIRGFVAARPRIRSVDIECEDCAGPVDDRYLVQKASVANFGATMSSRHTNASLRAASLPGVRSLSIAINPFVPTMVEFDPNYYF